MLRFAVLLALVPALAYGQALPTCALTCTTSVLSSGTTACTSVTDLTCICTNADFERTSYQCYVNECTPEELQAAIAYGAKLCQNNGTPIDTTATPSGITYPATRATAAASGASGAADIGSLYASEVSSASAFLSSAESVYEAALSSAESMYSSGATLSSIESALSASYSGLVSSVSAELASDLSAATASALPTASAAAATASA